MIRQRTKSNKQPIQIIIFFLLWFISHQFEMWTWNFKRNEFKTKKQTWDRQREKLKHVICVVWKFECSSDIWTFFPRVFLFSKKKKCRQRVYLSEKWTHIIFQNKIKREISETFQRERQRDNFPKASTCTSENFNFSRTHMTLTELREIFCYKRLRRRNMSAAFQPDLIRFRRRNIIFAPRKMATEASPRAISAPGYSFVMSIWNVCLFIAAKLAPTCATRRRRYGQNQVFRTIRLRIFGNYVNV